MATSSTKKQTGWFTKDIQQMMFSFGDSRKPLQETVELVEDIVLQQMTALLEQASEISQRRGEKKIGIESIIFLLRKDKNKLRRLFRFFEKKDMKNTIKSLATPEIDSDKHIINISVLEQEAVNKQTMSKERKTCYKFLCSIDQTGELLALFNDTEEDAIKHERMLRAEIKAQGMSTEQYFEFCKARQTGFSNFKKQFQEWIMYIFTRATVPSTAVIEVLSYLAHETVAQIVDFALLVKQDLQTHSADPQNVTAAVNNCSAEFDTGSPYVISQATTNSSQIPPKDISNPSQLKSLTSTIDTQTASALNPSNIKERGPQKDVMSWDCAILPSDVREAMRRYYTDISPFVSQTKVNHHCSTSHRTMCS